MRVVDGGSRLKKKAKIKITEEKSRMSGRLHSRKVSEKGIAKNYRESGKKEKESSRKRSLFVRGRVWQGDGDESAAHCRILSW